MTLAIERTDKSLITTLETLDSRLRWLSAWTIHNANHLRESRDGLKVGGHQASCASITAIMTALYFHALGPNDKVAVKPHAGPVLHSIHYLLGNQRLDQLQHLRGLGGAQSYPSRTKDKIPVDFSTGSVGLGVAVTAFASLVQDYLIAHGEIAETDAGRMIALMGDAELDEGNIYEALIEGYKHDLRNCWWIVDYNRQSTRPRPIACSAGSTISLRLAAGASSRSSTESGSLRRSPNRAGARCATGSTLARTQTSPR